MQDPQQGIHTVLFDPYSIHVGQLSSALKGYIDSCYLHAGASSKMYGWGSTEHRGFLRVLSLLWNDTLYFELGAHIQQMLRACDLRQSFSNVKMYTIHLGTLLEMQILIQ